MGPVAFKFIMLGVFLWGKGAGPLSDPSEALSSLSLSA